MTLSAPSKDSLDFLARAAEAYARLIARHEAHPESGLGGRLFYVGKLDDAGRELVVAANIASAATLAATVDLAAQKQVIRDGIADFLVTTLDEALRILKNQLRKREAVAVCVAMEATAMEREMHERGVAPDLLRSEVPAPPHHEVLLYQEGVADETDLTGIPARVIWRVDSGRHRDLAMLDEIALACLEPDEWAARRWLRLAPRYLGRLGHGLRLLLTHREFAARFSGRLRERVARGEIAFPFEILSNVQGLDLSFRFDPGKS